MLKVLDCTLRDGGYYTNWDFDADLVAGYLAAMAGSPVDMIEIGYRSPLKKGYFGKYFYLPNAVVAECKAGLRPDQKLALMLNEKDVQPEAAEGLLRDLVGVIDIIRMAVAPTALDTAVELSKACKAMGFEVGVNVMYLNKYAHDVSPLKVLDCDAVDYVSLVDSYGSCRPETVAKAIRATVASINKPIGFHGHDNIALAYANALAAIDAGATIVDATMQGMGRGAGNLNTETICTMLAVDEKRPLDFDAFSASSAQFGTMKVEYGWGSNLAYLLSGFSALPQADVMDWLGTRRYRLDAIVEALRFQGGGTIDERNLQSLATSNEFVAQAGGKPILILGGGHSVEEHAPALKQLAEKTDATIVHSSTRFVGMFDGLEQPQVYCLTGQEYKRNPGVTDRALQQASRLAAVPPPPRFADAIPEAANVFQVDRAGESDMRGRLGPVSDEAPLDLALDVAVAVKPSVVYLAGFDGYATPSAADRDNAADVQRAMDSAPGLLPETKVISITPTLYSVPTQSLYGILLER